MRPRTPGVPPRAPAEARDRGAPVAAARCGLARRRSSGPTGRLRAAHERLRPARSLPPPRARAPGAGAGAFNGIHLRIERDAADWTSIMGGHEAFWALYLRAAAAAGLGRRLPLYIASGILSYRDVDHQLEDVQRRYAPGEGGGGRRGRRRPRRAGRLLTRRTAGTSPAQPRPRLWPALRPPHSAAAAHIVAGAAAAAATCRAQPPTPPQARALLRRSGLQGAVPPSGRPRGAAPRPAGSHRLPGARP
jgi:hypothetical protein